MSSNDASSPRYTRRSPTRPFTRKTRFSASAPNRATWTTSAIPAASRPRRREPGLMSSKAIMPPFYAETRVSRVTDDHHDDIGERWTPGLDRSRRAKLGHRTHARVRRLLVAFWMQPQVASKGVLTVLNSGASVHAR